MTLARLRRTILPPDRPNGAGTWAKGGGAVVSTVFLVDDHALLRDGLRAIVESAGHRVVGEADRIAPALAGILHSAPEIVLLDLALGDRSGHELLRELQRRTSASRCIVISMSNRPADVAEALRLGAIGYVHKGAPRAELLAAIAAAVEGRQHLTPEIAGLALRGMTALLEPHQELSPRERQVLVLAARGFTNAESGAALNLSPKTVETYRTRAMRKLGLEDLPAVVRWAVREGHVDLGND